VEATLETAVDRLVVGQPDRWSHSWSTFASGLSSLSTLTLAALLAMLAVAILLSVVLPSNAEPIDSAPASATSRRISGAWPSGAELQLWPEPLPGASALAEGGAAEPLPVHTLSPTDLIALTALRRRIEAGEVSEGSTAPERLVFARWLLEHGRLSETAHERA
jgi:hypothetical protein